MHLPIKQNEKQFFNSGIQHTVILNYIKKNNAIKPLKTRFYGIVRKFYLKSEFQNPHYRKLKKKI